MAMLFQETKDGIQLGKELDRCRACAEKAKANRVVIKDGLLTNKEVFILNISGIRQCYCMDCLQDLLGDYVLLNGAALSDDEVLDLDGEVHTQEQLSTKEDKTNDAKKAKAGKPSKGK